MGLKCPFIEVSKVVFALIASFSYRGMGWVNKPWLRVGGEGLYPEWAKQYFFHDTALHVILWSSVPHRSLRFVSSFYLFLFAAPSFACACFCSSLYLLSSEAATRCNDKCTRSDLWVFINTTRQEINAQERQKNKYNNWRTVSDFVLIRSQAIEVRIHLYNITWSERKQIHLPILLRAKRK